MADTPEKQVDPSEPPVGLFISMGVVTGILFTGILAIYAIAVVWFIRF